MKRLIKKSWLTADDVQIGEEVYLQDDPNYENINFNTLSLPQYRDGAILVDIQDNKIYWGLNGESHANLVEKYYNVDQHDDESYKNLDKYVAYGMYLKDFLGKETIILYGALPGVEQIILQEIPGVAIYEEIPNSDDILKRLAKKNGK